MDRSEHRSEVKAMCIEGEEAVDKPLVPGWTLISGSGVGWHQKTETSNEWRIRATLWR